MGSKNTCMNYDAGIEDIVLLVLVSLPTYLLTVGTVLDLEGVCAMHWIHELVWPFCHRSCLGSVIAIRFLKRVPSPMTAAMLVNHVRKFTMTELTTAR